jgi:hypothetical protein
MIDLHVDLSELDRFRKDLERFRKKAIPYALREAVTAAAFEARKEWQGEIKRSFITRNQFTERSIRVEKARGLDAKRMFAVVGSTAPYMAKQEFGGIDHGAIPAPAASGESSLPRKRLVRRANKLAAIQLARRGKKGSRKQQNAISIRLARKAGKKFVLLRGQRAPAIFKITGGKRKLRVTRIQILAKRPARITAEPTLQRTLKALGPKMPRIMANALRKQLRFHKIGNY